MFAAASLVPELPNEGKTDPAANGKCLFRGQCYGNTGDMFVLFYFLSIR